MNRLIIALTLIPSLAFAGGWKPASSSFSRTPTVTSSSTDSGLGLYRNGRFLKVGPQQPSGRSSISNSMVGDVEISVATKANVNIPTELKGITMTTYGHTVESIARELEANGIGKIVKVNKDGSYVLDTSK